MSKPRARPARPWLALVVLIVSLYALLCCVVFGLRHPWMTETERFLHFPEALTWDTVDYDDARRRDR